MEKEKKREREGERERERSAQSISLNNSQQNCRHRRDWWALPQYKNQPSGPNRGLQNTSLMCRKRYIVFTVCSIAMLRGRKLWSAQLYQVLLTTHIYISQTSDNDMWRYIHSDLQFLIHNIMGTSSDSSLLKPKIV